MNIIHLSSEYPPQKVYGLGRFVRDIAEEQARQGCGVTVITNSIGGDEYDCTRNGVHVCRVAFPPPPKPRTVSSQVLIFNTLILGRFAELTKDDARSFDVVCSHDWLTAPSGCAIGQNYGIPHILTMHDTIIGKRLGSSQNIYDKFVFNAEQWACARATHVIANSKATQAELIDAYGLSRDKSTVIPCAINPANLQVTSDKVRLLSIRAALGSSDVKIILYVGRLDIEKGVDVLMHAVAALSSKFRNNVRLVIAGTGQQDKALQTLATDLTIHPIVRFLGYVDSQVLPHLYKVCDILVCPSRYEPFGLVALEGMLQGKAVVASNIGGLKEFIVHRENGLLCKPGAPDGLRIAIEELLGNDALRNTLGRKAKLSVMQSYTWNIVTKKTIETLQRVREEFQIRRRSLPIPNSTPIIDLALNDPYDAPFLFSLNKTAELLASTFGVESEVYADHWSLLFAYLQIPDFKKHVRLRSEKHVKDDYQEMWQWASGYQTASPLKSELIAQVEHPTAMNQFDSSPSKQEIDVITSELSGGKHILIVLLCGAFEAEEIDCFNKVALHFHHQSTSIRWIVMGDYPNTFEWQRRARELHLPFSFPGELMGQAKRALQRLSHFVIGPSADDLQTHRSEQVDATGILTRHSKQDLQLISNKYARCVEFPSEELNSGIKALLENSVPSNGVQKPDEAKSIDDLILYNNWGLGDELMLTAVAREIKRIHKNKRIWIRSRFGFSLPEYCERWPPSSVAVEVETIYQNPVICGPDYHSPYPGHLVQQMLDKVALDTGIKVTARSTKPEILLPSTCAKRNKRLVVLHSKPNKRFPSKDWGFGRWCQIAKLLNGENVEIAQVGDVDEELLPHATDYRSLAVRNVPELVASATLTICVVGFLMHVAAAVGTQAIVIYGGREHPAIDGYAGQLQIASDPIPCRGRWGCHLAPDASCPHGMRCMEHLTPELVCNLATLLMENYR